MSDGPPDQTHLDDLTRQDLLVINELCDRYEQQWKDWEASETRADWPAAESILADVPQHLRECAVRELVPIEMEYRNQDGQTLLLSDYTHRFPDIQSGWFILLLQESISDQNELGSTRHGDEVESDASFQMGPAFSSDGPIRIGQYEIVGKLGAGGMGTVYQAVHSEMQRDVAIKMMRADVSKHESSRKRFQREVQAAARLSHPNIVVAYDAGEFDGRPYLVSELVDGVDLRKLIKDQGPLDVQRAVRYVIDAAKGLQYAHQHEITHRDIKPANLLLSNRDDTVKVLDLGLARFSAETDTSDRDLTHTGAVMGTAGYMAPEQARSSKNADARSDIYSLGCVFYFLLEGKAPYRGESIVETLIAHATEPIPDLEVSSRREPIPDRLRQTLTAMMAKTPENRPQTMEEVIEKLGASFEDHDPQVGAKQIRQVKPLPVAIPLKADADSSPARTRIPNLNLAKSAPSRKQKDQPRAAKSSANQRLAIGALVACLLSFLVWWSYGGNSESYESNEGNGAAALLQGSGSGDSRTNRALVFDGQASYVLVPSIGRGPGDRVTLEVIARVDRQRTANAISWTGGNWMALFHNGQWGVGRLQGGQSMFCRPREESGQESYLGRWQHIAGTWDGSDLRIFVDGQPMSPGPMSFELGQTDAGLCIGGTDPGRLPAGQSDRFFQGAIDAVRIVDRVVYAADESFTPPERLGRVNDTLVLFQFDEPPNAESLRDDSGNNHTGEPHFVQTIVVE